MAYTTVLLQTITDFKGDGLGEPQPLEPSYTVPQGCTAGVQYFRAGSTSEGLVNVTLLQNGGTMRYLPVAAGGAIHVPLSIVDELQPGTEISATVAAESPGTLVLDVGILEVNTG